MSYELTKEEFIKLKKEELAYVDNVAEISSNKILSEYEKLEIYRKLKNYQIKLYEILKKLWISFPKDKNLTKESLRDAIIKIELDENFLSTVNFHDEYYKEEILEDLGIDVKTFQFKLTLRDLVNVQSCDGYKEIDYDIIQNNQKLIENPIYIFCSYYDSTEDCYGPCFGDYDSYIYGIYEDIYKNTYGYEQKEVPKKSIEEFEKDNIVIHSKRYVYSSEIRKIFKEELLNSKNQTINYCVRKTKNRIEELNYIRSPEYKEKILLDKINELYKKVKGEFIKEEILYSDDFIDVLKETYKLPDQKIVQKEKIVKKNRKDSVIIIPITQNKEYIVTFLNKIKDKIIAEFPSGNIKYTEDIVEAAKKVLEEKFGYTSDDLFIVDEALGSDKEVTYIVVANNCIKTYDKIYEDKENINYGLFKEKELEYLVNKNIMNESMNKLAYYSFINNTEDCNITHVKSNKKIYKTKKEKTNPLDY